MDKELEKLTKPLLEYLKENYHPHTAIVITDSQVAIVETTLSIPSGEFTECEFVPEDSDGKHYGNEPSKLCD